MTTIDAAKIAELRALLAKATPGPWGQHLVDDTTIIAENGFEIGSTWPDGGIDDDRDFSAPVEQHEHNAALIVAMRNVMPELLDAAERADSMVDEIDMLRESETHWIGRLSVVRQVTGDNGRMMLDEFAAWFEARWKSLIETESRASRAREDALREAAGIARNGWLIAPQSEQATMKERVAETATCDAIATAILALIDKPKDAPAPLPAAPVDGGEDA